MRALPLGRGLLALLLFPLAAAAHEDVGMLTLLEGQASLLRGAHGYLPVEAIKLKHADILQTGGKAFLQLEFDDGGVVELGPDTRLLVDIPGWRGQPPVVGPHFLLEGWVKLTVPKRANAPAYRLNTPHFDVLIGTGVIVMQMAAAEGSVFVESGDAAMLEPTGRNVTEVRVGTGRYYARRAGQKSAVAERPSAAFVNGMPPPFRDTLPARLAKLKTRQAAPKPGPEFSYEDVAGWLKADREVRRVLVPQWRSKALDPDFRAGLVNNLRHHPEWDPILFPEKYKPKEETEATDSITR